MMLVIPSAGSNNQDIQTRIQTVGIGRRGTVEWPARSPDLTPLDYFLWGYVKHNVFKTRPNDLQELQQRIINTCATITPVMLSNVRRSFAERVALCFAVDGQHIEHL
jgi:hypothetical protein